MTNTNKAIIISILLSIPIVFARDFTNSIGKTFNEILRFMSLSWVTDKLSATKFGIFIIIFALIYTILNTGLKFGKDSAKGLFDSDNAKQSKRLSTIIAFAIAAITVIFIPDKLALDIGNLYSAIFIIILTIIPVGILIFLTFKLSDKFSEPAKHWTRALAALMATIIIGMFYEDYNMRQHQISELIFSFAMLGTLIWTIIEIVKAIGAKGTGKSDELITEKKEIKKIKEKKITYLHTANLDNCIKIIKSKEQILNQINSLLNTVKGYPNINEFINQSKIEIMDHIHKHLKIISDFEPYFKKEINTILEQIQPDLLNEFKTSNSASIDNLKDLLALMGLFKGSSKLINQGQKRNLDQFKQLFNRLEERFNSVVFDYQAQIAILNKILDEEKIADAKLEDTKPNTFEVSTEARTSKPGVESNPKKIIVEEKFENNIFKTSRVKTSKFNVFSKTSLTKLIKKLHTDNNKLKKGVIKFSEEKDSSKILKHIISNEGRREKIKLLIYLRDIYIVLNKVLKNEEVISHNTKNIMLVLKNRSKIHDSYNEFDSYYKHAHKLTKKITQGADIKTEDKDLRDHLINSYNLLKSNTAKFIQEVNTLEKELIDIVDKKYEDEKTLKQQLILIESKNKQLRSWHADASKFWDTNKLSEKINKINQGNIQPEDIDFMSAFDHFKRVKGELQSYSNTEGPKKKRTTSNAPGILYLLYQQINDSKNSPFERIKYCQDFIKEFPKVESIAEKLEAAKEELILALK